MSVVTKACNARPPQGHPFAGTMVACHAFEGHEDYGIPHTWEHRPSLARQGLNRLLALMPTRDLEAIDPQAEHPLIARDVRTGEESVVTRYPPGPWVVVKFIGGDQYAIWKSTGSVYRVQADGSVAEDPMLTLDGHGLADEERTELRRTPPPEG